MKVSISRQASADIATQFAANNLLESVEVDAEAVEEVIDPAPVEVATPPEVVPDSAPSTDTTETDTPASE